MSKLVRNILILVAVASFGIALSYPILYRTQQEDNMNSMEELAGMREAALSQAVSSGEDAESNLSGTETQNPSESEWDLAISGDSRSETPGGGEKGTGSTAAADSAPEREEVEQKLINRP